MIDPLPLERASTHFRIRAGITCALRIKDQNGLVYLPHPYDRFRRHCSDEILEDLAELIDIVEVFNGRSEETANRRAADLCEILRAAPGAGSDAHTLPELGGVYVEIDEFDGPREFVRRLRSARIVRRPNRWRMRLDALRRPRFG